MNTNVHNVNVLFGCTCSCQEMVKEIGQSFMHTNLLY